MLVIVANCQDEAAQRLAERWHNYGAGVLTPLDLSTGGWRHYLPFSAKSTAVVGGQRVATAEISGVLTRMPWVYEQELAQIVAADRAYVASEMTAFLHAWLSGLHCPVINRSTPNCLAGPNWRAEQWIRLGAGLGIPVRSHRRRSEDSGESIAVGEAGAEAIVVGDHAFGDVDPELQAWARQLARAAGVDLLAVQFTGAEPGAKFLNASLWPSIASDDVADAIFARLGGRSLC